MDTDDYMMQCMTLLVDTNTYRRTEYSTNNISDLLTNTLQTHILEQQQTPIQPPPTKHQTLPDTLRHTQNPQNVSTPLTLQTYHLAL